MSLLSRHYGTRAVPARSTCRGGFPVAALGAGPGGRAPGGGGHLPAAGARQGAAGHAGAAASAPAAPRAARVMEEPALPELRDVEQKLGRKVPESLARSLRGEDLPAWGRGHDRDRLALPAAAGPGAARLSSSALERLETKVHLLKQEMVRLSAPLPPSLSPSRGFLPPLPPGRIQDPRLGHLMQPLPDLPVPAKAACPAPQSPGLETPRSLGSRLQCLTTRALRKILLISQSSLPLFQPLSIITLQVFDVFIGIC